jgi:hypothetical protein
MCFNIGTISVSTSDRDDASASTINGAINGLNIGFYMGDNWAAGKVNISVTKVSMGKNFTVLSGYFFLWLCKLRKANVQDVHKNTCYFIVQKTFI